MESGVAMYNKERVNIISPQIFNLIKLYYYKLCKDDDFLFGILKMNSFFCIHT